MQSVNMHEAKTHLSKLVEKVAAGQEVVIGKAGRPVARLIPANRPIKKRELGFLAGRLHVPKGFDTPIPDEWMNQFEGEGPASAP